MRNPFAIKDDPLRPVPPEAYGWRVHILALSAAWASGMFGYDQAFIGGTLALPSFQNEFGIKQGTPQYTKFSSNVTSIFQAGCFFGGLMGYYCSERFGRKKQLIGSGIIFSLGVVMQLAAFGHLPLMYVGRILTGVGVGASAMCVPVFIAESSPPPIRGRLVGIFEISLQVFGVFGFWINYGVQRNMQPSRSQWQVPFAIQLVPAGLLLIFMPFMPESPRWLARNNRIEEAIANLSWVRNLPADHPFVQDEIRELTLSLERESGSAGGNFWKESIKTAGKPGIRNRFVLAIGLKVLQNLTGTQAINYYSPRIFQSIGFRGTLTSLLATGVFGLVKMLATCATMFWAVDSVGRRPLLLIGSAGSMIPMFYLGAYSKISNSFNGTGAADPDAGGYVAIVMVFIFSIFFAISWNGVPWIFASEVFPNRIRTLGLMTSMSFTWVVQFAIVFSTPYMIADIQYGMFFFFGSCITCAGIIVYLFVPETKGVAMEHMDYIFNGSVWGVKARRDAEVLIAEHNLAITAGDDVALKKPHVGHKEV